MKAPQLKDMLLCLIQKQTLADGLMKRLNQVHLLEAYRKTLMLGHCLIIIGTMYLVELKAVRLGC